MLYWWSTDLKTSVASVLNDHDFQLNVTVRAITETRKISMSINKQSFASEEETIQMHKSSAEQSATTSRFYSTSIESINARVTNISVALGMDVTRNVW